MKELMLPEFVHILAVNAGW